MLREGQGAPVTAVALSVIGVHQHPPEDESGMGHLMTEARERGVARLHGTVGLITVLVLEERAEVQLMMLKGIKGTKGIEVPLKIMVTTAVLAPSEGRTGVLLTMTMITMGLLEAVNQLKGAVRFTLVLVFCKPGVLAESFIFRVLILNICYIQGLSSIQICSVSIFASTL